LLPTADREKQQGDADDDAERHDDAVKEIGGKDRHQAGKNGKEWRPHRLSPRRF
jgi:hypothetical protein